MKKRIFALLIAMALLTVSVCALAEPPAKPEGTPPAGQGSNPPDMPTGNPPDGMGTPPDGMGNPPDGMGGPGGQSSAPSEYAAVNTLTEDATLTGAIESTGTDENAVHVAAGETTIEDAQISRVSNDSTGGDSASFYGVGAAVLTTGGSATVRNSAISTDAKGGAGVFAYGDGIVYVADSTIETVQDTSGGIHVAGGGTLYASNLTVTTQGESSAAIRSDRGGGLLVADGGSYTSNGVGSPAVYVTADITVHNAQLTANGSEALCLEGLNAVRLYDCTLSGNMADLDQNDNTWNVILYQSMSGDSQVGKGSFEMTGGTLIANNGGIFYTTNTESEFVLSNVTIQAAADSEYFLRCTGNSNQRGWGTAGANGADCVFTGIAQQMQGNVIWDSISTLDLYLTAQSTLTGAVVQDESCAGEGGNGYCVVHVSENSTWTVTADSTVTALYCAGNLADAQGNAVRVVSPEGEVLREGTSDVTVTADYYEAACDLSCQGAVGQWSDYAVEF